VLASKEKIYLFTFLYPMYSRCNTSQRESPIPMLYLSRKIGESVIINNNIELTVVEVRGKSVKIGFTFPPDATVLRKELHDKIVEQNVAAATASDDQALIEALIDMNVHQTGKDKP
jgi:carbon storage regulator